jgi:hypothetical protein
MLMEVVSDELQLSVDARSLELERPHGQHEDNWKRYVYTDHGKTTVQKRMVDGNNHATARQLFDFRKRTPTFSGVRPQT